MAVDGEVLLETAANGNGISLQDWPIALEAIFARLDHIIKEDFPIPRIPEPGPPPPPLFGEAFSKNEDASSSQSSTATDKENDPPQRPPVPPFPASDATTQPTGTDLTNSQSEESSPPMPQHILDLLVTIRQALDKTFRDRPPHTLQRLAELIMYPTQHYRYLPSYLRAVDRVVCVTSGADIFPLPQVTLSLGASLPNGTTNGQNTLSFASLGSDESLGGALLTPIPWLKPERNVEENISPSQAQALNQLHGQRAPGQNELKSEETEMVEGPNGVGRIETVSVVNGVLIRGVDTSGSSAHGTSSGHSATLRVEDEDAGQSNPPSVEESLREAGAITQGELIRLEQEAGVVPVSVASRSPQRHRVQAVAGPAGPATEPIIGDMGIPIDADDGAAGDEDLPHARGPAEIGTEDVGPRQERLGSPETIDMQRAVGRRPGLDEAVTTQMNDGAKTENKKELEESRDGVADVAMGEAEGAADNAG